MVWRVVISPKHGTRASREPLLLLHILMWLAGVVHGVNVTGYNP
jgi:hypothetical protein